MDKQQQIKEWVQQIMPQWLEGFDKEMPNMFYVLTQALYSMEYKMAQEKIKDADVIIRPDLSGIGTFDFHRGPEAFLKGYETTRNILSKQPL